MGFRDEVLKGPRGKEHPDNKDLSVRLHNNDGQYHGSKLCESTGKVTMDTISITDRVRWIRTIFGDAGFRSLTTIDQQSFFKVRF